MDGLQAERTTQVSPTEELFFDVNAQLEEQKRGSNEVTLNFSLLITTKPNIVKYSTRGIVTLEGPSADVQKKLEANPKTKIGRFKCSQCHNDQSVNVARAAEMAHGDIKLDHGGQEKPLSCFTCHNKEDRDALETEAGVKVGR